MAQTKKHYRKIARKHQIAANLTCRALNGKLTDNSDRAAVIRARCSEINEQYRRGLITKTELAAKKARIIASENAR